MTREASGARLTDVLDAIPFGVAIYDANEALVAENTAFRGLVSGARAQSATGPGAASDAAQGANPGPADKSSATLSSAWPTAAKDLEAPLERLRRSRLAATKVVGLAHEGATRKVEITLSPITSADGGIVLVAVVLDEDEQRRRLAATGELAAGLMHDVNNVLNPIQAAAYLIEELAGDNTTVKEYAQRIVRSAERGTARLRQLREFVRQEPLEEPPGDRVDLAAEVRTALAEAAGMWSGRDATRGIRVEHALEAGVEVRIPGPEVRTVVLNLVQNAVEAMPEGGTLTIDVARRNGTAVLTVRDTGRGMTPDARSRAFEPFYGRTASKGTGLGLAEVYGIVRRHHGVAAIESGPGAGTVVKLKFPMQ
jgi:signal transduction histidine kinase